SFMIRLLPISTLFPYTTLFRSSDIPFFNNGNSGFYGITDNLRFGFDDIVTLTNNFLGIFDLDDEGNNGTNQFATITFSPINVSADRKSTRLNSSHVKISYAVFC